MNNCDKCNVKIHTSENICPLCKNKIDFKNNNSIFPQIKPKYKRHNLLKKITMFLSSCGIIFSLLINYTINKGFSWSLFVVLGIISFWLTFINGIKKRHNFYNLLITEIISLIILSIIWDYYTGFYKWSLIFVLPFLCVAYTITFLILRIFTNKTNKDYIVYTYLNCLIGLIPMYFIFTNKFKIIWPAYISVTTSIFTIIFLVIFNHRTLEKEIEKRFHI
ncbi:MAG: hypothetical protein E7163_03590 [Firmicutes bacterium]|nr:hypothetical protein [Bacillota bacterium]